MMEIEWDKAPEGTTHAFRPTRLGQATHWRMVGEFDVYYWVENQWEPLDGDDDPRDPAEWVEEFVENGDAVARPAPVEAELPDGKVWPEGADFYYPNLGVFFRWDAPGFKYPHDAAWSALMPMHIEQYAKKDVIHRFLGAKPKAAPKEEAPKKRAVGWWN